MKSKSVLHSTVCLLWILTAVQCDDNTHVTEKRAEVEQPAAEKVENTQQLYTENEATELTRSTDGGAVPAKGEEHHAQSTSPTEEVSQEQPSAVHDTEAATAEPSPDDGQQVETVKHSAQQTSTELSPSVDDTENEKAKLQTHQTSTEPSASSDDAQHLNEQPAHQTSTEPSPSVNDAHYVDVMKLTETSTESPELELPVQEPQEPTVENPPETLPTSPDSAESPTKEGESPMEETVVVGESADLVRKVEVAKEKLSAELVTANSAHGGRGNAEGEANDKVEPSEEQYDMDEEYPIVLEMKATGSTPTEVKEEKSSETPLEVKEKEQPGRELYHAGMKRINSTNVRAEILTGYQNLKAAAQMGNSDAEVEIAFAHLTGLHLPMDIQRALTIFHKHSQEGHARAQTGLGFLHATGIGVNASQARALLYWTFSAMGGDPMGQMMLGYRFYAGVGVTKDCETALTYYKGVAEKIAAGVSVTGGMMVVKIRLQDEEDNPGAAHGRVDDDLIQYYQFLADKGDASAQVTLGQLNFQGGRGVERDHGRAHELFRRAADSGNGNAQAYLGKIYAEGSDKIEQDHELALSYFSKAAAQGNPIGQAGLGMMYMYGKGVEQDYNMAMKNFKLSADQGWPEGQLHLGNMYHEGKGVKRDFKQAFQLFSVAAQNGHLLALYYLAKMHAIGVGVARSCSTATELYKNVCERGHTALMFDQAYSQYKSGNIQSALAVYALLAEMGHEVAQSNVAFILDQGQATELFANATDSRALQLFSRAAAQGYVNARIKLGDYHYYGRGTPVNYETAATHYKTASDMHNNAQALFNLGYMHEQGLGLSRDIHLAKRHYDMAGEASPDAAAPVAIALVKLAFFFVLEMFQQLPWLPPVVGRSWIFSTLVHYWDIYLMTLLSVLVGYLVTMRRRRPR